MNRYNRYLYIILYEIFQLFLKILKNVLNVYIEFDSSQILKKLNIKNNLVLFN